MAAALHKTAGAARTTAALVLVTILAANSCTDASSVTLRRPGVRRPAAPPPQRVVAAAATPTTRPTAAQVQQQAQAQAQAQAREQQQKQQQQQAAAAAATAARTPPPAATTTTTTPPRPAAPQQQQQQELAAVIPPPPQTPPRCPRGMEPSDDGGCERCSPGLASAGDKCVECPKAMAANPAGTLCRPTTTTTAAAAAAPQLMLNKRPTTSGAVPLPSPSPLPWLSTWPALASPQPASSSLSPSSSAGAAAAAAAATVTPPQPPPPTKCGAGEAYDSSSQVCIGPCAAGEFLDLSKPACRRCDGSSWSKAGATGSCTPCADGLRANAHRTACASVGDECSNGLRDEMEADVDCGGACPSRCDFNAACRDNSDCLTGFCDKQSGDAPMCACPPRADGGAYVGISADRKTCLTLGDMCADGFIWPEHESDVDCGRACASVGRLCKIGQKCVSGADCSSGSCDAASSRCACPLGTSAVVDANGKTVACAGTLVGSGSTKSASASSQPAPAAAAGAAAADSSGGVPSPSGAPLAMLLAPPSSSLPSAAQAAAAPAPPTLAAVACGASQCGQGCARRCAVGQGCRADADCARGLVCDDAALTCSCPRGFGGADCSKRLTTCDVQANPCKHGGECNGIPGAAPDFTCSCADGYVGAACDRNCWREGLVSGDDGASCVACGPNSEFLGSKCVCAAGFEDLAGESVVPSCRPCPEGTANNVAGGRCAPCPGFPAAGKASASATRPNADRTQCSRCSADYPNSVLFGKQCGCADDYFLRPLDGGGIICVRCPAGCGSVSALDMACRDQAGHFCATS